MTAKAKERGKVSPISIRNQIDRSRLYLAGTSLGPFLIRAVAGTGAVQLAGMLVTFLVGIQLARGLGVEGYGLYGVAMAILSLASVPSEFGLPRLVIREVAGSAARRDLPALFGVIRWANKTSLLISGLMAGAIAVGA